MGLQVGPAHAGGRNPEDGVHRLDNLRRVALLETHVAVKNSSFHTLSLSAFVLTVPCIRHRQQLRDKSFAVLLVADLFHPIDDLTVERFLNGDMRHGRGRRSTMPMLLARRDRDDIAGMDLLDRTALALRPTATGGDDQRLPERMGVPRGAAPGSNVTLAPDARAGAFAWNKGSMRTVPVNQSAGPLLDGCEPILLISILICCVWVKWASTCARRIAGVASTAPVVFRKLRRERAIMSNNGFRTVDR